MLGHSHALSGVAAGLGAGLVLGMSAAHTLELGGFTAGMALLLDLDSCGSSPARSLGFLSGAVSHVVRRISGGHRHATHSLLGIAVFTGLAWLACHFRHDDAGMAGLALLIALTVSAGAEATHAARNHVADAAGIAVATAVVWFGWGLALIPLAVLLGTVAHALADSCTDSGVNWLWPVSMRRWHLPEPFAISTGTRPETLIVDPLLLAAIAVLGADAVAPGLVLRVVHAAIAAA